MGSGRRTKVVEQLESIIVWAGGPDAFEKATGIRKADQKHYLAGTKSISMQRLKHAAQQVFSQPPPAFVVHAERERIPAKLPATLKSKCGVYALFNSSGSLLYFGKASNLHFEIGQTLRRTAPRLLVCGQKHAAFKFSDLACYYSAYEVLRSDGTFRHDLESLVIRVTRRDALNRKGGNFQRAE